MSGQGTIGLILLAAGASTRMRVGQKQLLPYDERSSLLRHAAETAAGSMCSPIVIVLGSNAEPLRSELNGLAVQTVVNEDWANGIGSSIAVGVKALLQVAAQTTAAIIALADQPLITADFYNHLTAVHQRTNAPIVAAEYNDAVGVPALFAAEFFPALSSLTGNAGAKRIIAAQSARTIKTPAPEAAFDIDTPEDYQRFRQIR